jgi:hypothetical protein
MNGKAPFFSLILVGTVHRDPRGVGKLLRLLERETPDVITVEISPYALEFRRKQAFRLRALLRENLKKIQAEDGGSSEGLLKHGEIQGIFFLLKAPFEWRAAERYSRKHRCGLKAIDLSAYSQEKLARVPELIEPENLRALLRAPCPSFENRISREYEKAKILWFAASAARLVSEEVREREKHMAEEIRRIIKEDDKRKILHVGGWEHLLPASRMNSLYARMEDLKPRRLLLEYS